VIQAKTAARFQKVIFSQIYANTFSPWPNFTKYYKLTNPLLVCSSFQVWQVLTQSLLAHILLSEFKIEVCTQHKCEHSHHVVSSTSTKEERGSDRWVPLGNFAKKRFSTLTKGGCSHGFMPELRIFRQLKGSPVDNGSERFSIVGGNQSKGSEIKPQQKGLGFKLRRLTAFKVCNILSRYPPPTHTPTPTHTHTHTHWEGAESASLEGLGRTQLAWKHRTKQMLRQALHRSTIQTFLSTVYTIVYLGQDR
jgi:hypothetical protein